MNTYGQMIYMVRDLLKISSDDSYITSQHILFMLEKFRAYVLKSKYEDDDSEMPDTNKSSLTVELELVEDNLGYSGIPILRSKQPIPSDTIFDFISVRTNRLIGNPNIVFVPFSRFAYTGNNKYLRNIIYWTIDNDNYILVKSCNPRFEYLTEFNIEGVFESPMSIAEADCACKGLEVNYDDVDFCLEDALSELVLDYVVKSFQNSIYKPEDDLNNTKDDLSGLAVRTPSERYKKQQWEQ